MREKVSRAARTWCSGCPPFPGAATGGPGAACPALQTRTILSASPPCAGGRVAAEERWDAVSNTEIMLECSDNRIMFIKATYCEDSVEAVERILLDHVAEQQGGDEAHALTVAHLRVQRSIPGEHAPQRHLPRAAVLVEHLVHREGAVDIAPYLQ